MKTPPFNFLGIDEDHARYDRARVAVLPVPYEATVSYGRGTAKAPQAIIAASAQVELYDEELGCLPFDVGVATLDAIDVGGLSTSEMAKLVKPAVAKIIADGKLPLVLGGEHSITPAVAGAVAEAHGDITVVQLDAHADLRQEYEGERMSHACAMARVREICPAVQVGIRSISLEEARWAAKERFPIFYARNILRSEGWMEEVLSAIETDKVYVTIDVDVFDAALMPATGTPEPGGLGWYHVTDFLRMLCKRKRVTGFDLVELSPIGGMRACDFIVAKLAYKCIGYWREGQP